MLAPEMQFSGFGAWLREAVSPQEFDCPARSFRPDTEKDCHATPSSHSHSILRASISGSQTVWVQGALNDLTRLSRVAPTTLPRGARCTRCTLCIYNTRFKQRLRCFTNLVAGRFLLRPFSHADALTLQNHQEERGPGLARRQRERHPKEDQQPRLPLSHYVHAGGCLD